MQYICPLMVVEDIERSRIFYEDILGLKVVLDFGANITFDGGFSLQSKESWSGFIDRDEEAVKFGANNFELYFNEDAFDDFVKKIKSRPVELVHDMKQYPWGQRVIRFFDPDMHIIEVGESMEYVVRRFYGEGLTIDEIAQRTQHPVEFVESCISTVDADPVPGDEDD